MTRCIILASEKEAIYMWQNRILIFYINTTKEKTIHSILEKVCIFDSSNVQLEFLSMEFWYWSQLHESDW